MHDPAGCDVIQLCQFNPIVDSLQYRCCDGVAPRFTALAELFLSVDKKDDSDYYARRISSTSKNGRHTVATDWSVYRAISRLFPVRFMPTQRRKSRPTAGPTAAGLERNGGFRWSTRRRRQEQHRSYHDRQSLVGWADRKQID